MRNFLLGCLLLLMGTRSAFAQQGAFLQCDPATGQCITTPPGPGVQFQSGVPPQDLAAQQQQFGPIQNGGTTVTAVQLSDGRMFALDPTQDLFSQLQQIGINLAGPGGVNPAFQGPLTGPADPNVQASTINLANPFQVGELRPGFPGFYPIAPGQAGGPPDPNNPAAPRDAPREQQYPGDIPQAEHFGPGQQPGQLPPGQNPPGQLPPGQLPPGQNPPGQNPPGQNPPGQFPPGQNPPGQLPPGQNPPPQNPPGQNPPGQPGGPGQPAQPPPPAPLL